VSYVEGRLNSAGMIINRPSTFYGQCSKLCGTLHGFMPIGVHAVTIPSYLNWLDTHMEADAIMALLPLVSIRGLATKSSTAKVNPNVAVSNGQTETLSSRNPTSNNPTINTILAGSVNKIDRKAVN
jgi:heme/copper-type cytochrome/quinol oxidase subunit 2